MLADNPLGKSSSRAFDDQFQFVDDIHGRIVLNNLERDAIDTPEFQRLFRIAQLGLVEIAFQTANHSRGSHSIGTCHAAELLLRALRRKRQSGLQPSVSRAEGVLVRLGALLHDIPHGPYSHDIEKKKHEIRPFSNDEKVKIKSANGPYEKHDDYEENAAFYIAVFDTKHSVLARVLRHYSPAFWQLLEEEAPAHLADFRAAASRWPGVECEILPQLLFHLFAFEDMPRDGRYSILLRTVFDGDVTAWHLGPANLAQELHESWYQPFRHEIIGNTLSADLIDYLARDCAHLQIKGGIDENLLRFYTLVEVPGIGGRSWYRCAINLRDEKRGIVRTDRLNDIFQMLELRHQIHEKAVYHRMAQSSLAMLSRAIRLAQDFDKRNPGQAHEPLLAETLYGFGTDDVAVRGDEHFLRRLMTHPNGPTQQLARKIAERRLFRPLMIVPGHRVAILLGDSFDVNEKGKRDKNLRELASIIDSDGFAPFFRVVAATIEALLRHEFTDIEIEKTAAPKSGSLEAFMLQFTTSERAAIVPANHRVLFWTLPYKQLFKDPAIVVTSAPGPVHSLDELYTMAPSALDGPAKREFALIKERVTSGITDADVRYAQLWKIYVFLSDGLFYGGCMAKLIQDKGDYAWPCANRGNEHEKHLKAAGILAGRAINAAWRYWDDEKTSFGQNTAKAEQLLSRPPTSQMMESLISSVLRTHVNAEGASEVKFEQYQHADEDDEHRCRDIRYRFEQPPDMDTAAPLQELLRTLNCSKRFFASEANELRDTLQPDAEFVAQLQRCSTASESDTLVRLRVLQHRMDTFASSVRSQTPELPGRALVERILTAIYFEDYVGAVVAGREVIDGGNSTDAEVAVAIRLADTAEHYARIIASAARHDELGSTESALQDLAFLEYAETEGALDTLRSRAHLLRAQLHLRKGNDAGAARDVSAAAVIDVSALRGEVERLESILRWRQLSTAFATKNRRRRPSDIPRDIRERMETAVAEDQQQFFAVAQARIARPTTAHQRLVFGDAEWREVYENFRK